MAEKPSYEELEKRVQELEQPKAALCESEGQFKSLVSNIPGIIYRCKFDKAWTMLYINAEVERISGYPSSHFINNSVRTYESIIHRDDTAFVDKSVTDCIKTNQNWDIQYRIIHKDGRAQWVHEKGYAIVDDTGAVQYLDGFIIDIHELHNVRIEKERTAMELTQLIDTANAPIFGVDVEGKINEWNQMVARITGYDKDEVEGKNLVKGYISEEYRASVTEVLNNALKGEETANYEVPLFTKDGERIMVLLNATTRRDAQGNIVGVVGVGQDITELRQHQENLERAVKERIKELNCLYDISNLIEKPDSSLDEILQGAVDLIPPAWQYPEVTCARVTLRNHEFKSKTFREGVSKQTSGITVRGERIGSVEVCYVEKMPEMDEGPFLREERNLINSVAEHLRIIIEKRWAEEELEQALSDTELARDKIDGILKSVADGLIVTDPYNRIVLLNQAAEDLLGVRLTEVIDRPIDFAIEDKTLLDRVKDTLDKKATGHQFDFEQPGDDPKHPRIMRARTSVVHDREGKEAGIVTIVHDVTYEREVDRMKTDFLSIAAHELRTPMTSVLGYSELLLIKDNLSEENKNEFIKNIHEESVAVTKLINDLLDISRIESGTEPPLNKEWCIAGDLIRKIAPYFVESSPKHRLEIILPKEQHKLFVDKDKMAQVINNIIDNAVKYSPDGGVIRITGKLIGDNYQVSIQDQGIGMTSEETENMFDRFFRTATSQTSGIRGLGLGMSITKHIVELHKGMISAESEPGKGTTVSFTIPVSSDETAAYQI